MSSETSRNRLIAVVAVILAGGAIWQLWPNQSEPEIVAEIGAESSEPVAEESAKTSAAPAETTQVEDSLEVAVLEQAAEPEPAPVDEPKVTEPEALPENDPIEVEGIVEDTPVEEDKPAVVEVAEPVLAPSLDTFRVENDGQAVLAGRAGPGALLDIIVAGEVAERLTADGSGSFFTFLDLMPSDESRSLTVVADPDGEAVQMAQTYFIEPFGAEPEAVEVATSETVAGAVTAVEDTELETAEVAQSETLAEVEAEPQAEAGTTEIAEAPVATVEVETAEAVSDNPVADEAEVVVSEVGEELTQDAEANQEIEIVEDIVEEIVPDTEEAVVVAEAIEDIFGDTLEPESDEAIEGIAAADTVDPQLPTEAPQTPTVLEVDDEGVRVVTSSATPQAQTQIALDTITYDPSGEVLIAGRASTDGFVQVYIDNTPVTTSRISSNRNWSTELPEVDTGIYTLRIDEVDTEGTVVSRIETPFKREEPETVAAVMADETQQDDFEVAVKTVQPGSTLWAIAREQYGEGILYVSVFEANRDLIRDPDLIYPGQIFVLPELDENVEE